MHSGPKVLEFNLPGEIADGCELVCNVSLDGTLGVEGSIQASLVEGKVQQAAGLVAGDAKVAAKTGAWTNNSQLLGFTSPIIASENSQTRKRIEAGFDEFRNLFPAALCYTKIVPVDEVVTLTLFYREDDHLCRLMLDEEQQGLARSTLGRTALRQPGRADAGRCLRAADSVRHAGRRPQGV